MCSLVLCEINLFHFCISVPIPLPRLPPRPRCCCFRCRRQRHLHRPRSRCGEREWSCVLLVVDGGEAIPLRSRPGGIPIDLHAPCSCSGGGRTPTCSHEIASLRLERQEIGP